MKCINCTGHCCYLDTGSLNHEDVTRIAAHLGIEEEVLKNDYTENGHLLKISDTGCIFLKNGMCSIQEVKPRNCREYKCRVYEE